MPVSESIERKLNFFCRIRFLNSKSTGLVRMLMKRAFAFVNVKSRA